MRRLRCRMGKFISDWKECIKKGADQMEKILEVKNLCKTYIVNKRQNNVLRNVNFSIEKGEMAAVMGPSGSGNACQIAPG